MARIPKPWDIGIRGRSIGFRVLTVSCFGGMRMGDGCIRGWSGTDDSPKPIESTGDTKESGRSQEVMSETLEARVKAETITAMKARDGERTTTLRLITTALKNKAIEKRAG